MFSSIVKAGMRAITPKGKTEGARGDAADCNNHALTTTTTPKAFSQASVATPSTAATVDITANTTLDSIVALDQMAEQQQQQQSKQQKQKRVENKRTNPDETKGLKSNPKEPFQTTTTSTTVTAKPTVTTPALLWQVLDTQLRSNIGTSVRCGICLSTVSDPVRTPCSHGFCRGCITGYLKHSGTNACPECKAPCTRRSLETFSELDEMADSYKGMLRAFGLAPGIYTPEITTMTQKVVDTTTASSSGASSCTTSSSTGYECDDDEDLDPGQARQARLDRLFVSATYQRALPNCPKDACSKLQIRENEQVVNANLEACFGDQNDYEDQLAMNDLLDSHAKSKTPETSMMISSQAFPNTQDVHEQAREQLEADREMEESMQAQEEEDDEENKESRLNQQQQPEQQEQDDDFFALCKKPPTSSSNNNNNNNIKKEDPFAFPKEPQASPPPIFARADSGTKNLNHARKSFSKRDGSERSSFGGNALSPIDHEASFWTVTDASNRKESLGISHMTGMLEDSRGGMHMMAMKSSSSSAKDANETDFCNDDDENSEDKTIAFTMDDSPGFSRTSEGGNEKEKNQKDDEDENNHSDDSTSSSREEQEYFPLTYDPIGHPTEITEEYHRSTKAEIFDAANLPAGQEDEEDIDTKKKLFATPTDNKKKKKKQQTKKAAAKKAVTRNSSRRATAAPAKVSNMQEEEDSNPHSENNVSAPLENSSKCESTPEFLVGTIVRVQARTWPGVNKQGGVGRITGQNEDGTYNVSYVLGGKESKIDAVFVSKEDQGDDDERNNKSIVAAKTNRKRSRRAKDTLPEELLKQLAAEGFDVPGLKVKPKKNVKSSAASALADSTNQRKSAGSKRKRKEEASTASLPPTQPRTGRRKQQPSMQDAKPVATTNRRKKQARSIEDANLPTTVKKVKEAPPTKKKAAKKTVTFSTVPSTKRASRKKPPATAVEPSAIESDHKDAIQIADAWQKQKLEEAINNKNLVAVRSNLGEIDDNLFSSLLSKQVMKPAYSVDEKTQLCVVPSVENGNEESSMASVRTLKVMLSALRGIPLVTPNWLRTCYLEEKIVAPQSFLRSMPTKDPSIRASGDNLCGVTRLAVARSTGKTDSLPFSNLFACLCGGYEGKTKASMQELLEVGGAKILSTSQELEAKLREISSDNKIERIVVVCGNAGRGTWSRKNGIKLATPATRGLKDMLKQRQEKHPLGDYPASAIIVDSQWVIESVTCARAMPPNLFEPSIMKDLWKLCL